MSFHVICGSNGFRPEPVQVAVHVSIDVREIAYNLDIVLNIELLDTQLNLNLNGSYLRRLDRS